MINENAAAFWEGHHSARSPQAGHAPPPRQHATSSKEQSRQLGRIEHEGSSRIVTGTGRLYSTPNGQPERDHGTRNVNVLAGQTQTVSWTSIDSPTIGSQQLRVTDATGPTTTLNVAVRGVHLHATQPRENYTAGNAFSL